MFIIDLPVLVLCGIKSNRQSLAAGLDFICKEFSESAPPQSIRHLHEILVLFLPHEIMLSACSGIVSSFISGAQ